MDEIIAKAEEVAGAVQGQEDALANMARMADDTAALLQPLASQMNNVRNSAAGMGAAADAAAGQLNDLRNAAAGAAAAQGAQAAAADGAAVSGARTYGWLRLTGNAIHWLVMGTLEIASTAIPAMVAFGAAILAMTPAFTFAKDQMTNLVIASGSLTNAIRNSPGPLHALAAGLGQVQQSATPDAFIILGSAISVATTHTGVFAGMAQKASDVLATFATKIVTDLQGPAGAALSGFFNNAVKYMVQWGQVLGNLGHTFLNAVAAMFGVGQILLDVLVRISGALLAISNNPVGATLIGLAAAMSAVYRYGKLMVTIFNWLGGSAMVSAIKWAAGYGTALAGLAAEEGVVAAASLAMGDLMTAAMGPVGIAIGVIVAGLGLWYLASRNTSDATDQLIKRVQAMPPTVQNLSSGISTLTKAMAGQEQQQKRLSDITNVSGKSVGVLAYDQQKAAGDISKLSTAIGQQEQKLIELNIGLAQLGSTQGQVGKDMLALSIQTDLQDSKVTQLNQAWDQYMSLVTGGTSGLGGMSEALLNIGKVTINAGQALKGYNATTGLTMNSAARQMENFGQIGSQVWQNFNSTLTGSMQPLADWLRTAQTAGAITGPAFSKAILDMASGLTGFAKDSKPAQAELVAFAQESGLNIKTFPQLERVIKDSGASTKDLTGKVTDATIAMGNLNSIAKNLSQTLATQETQAIAAAALKASGFTTDIKNMMTAEETHARVGGLTWQQWAAKAQAAQHHAQGAADATIRKLQALQREVDSLHGKNINIGIQTQYTSTGSPAGTYGPQNKGGSPALGATGGYVHGPGSSTSDSIAARLSHGEYVMQASAVDRYGRGLLDAMNAKSYASGGIVPGSPSPSMLHATLSGGGGAVTLNQTHNLAVKMDGATVLSAQRKEQLSYYRRNPAGNWQLRNR